ncbi:MAG: alpha/beta hydrolase family protein [Bacillota bacterium]
MMEPNKQLNQPVEIKKKNKAIHHIKKRILSILMLVEGFSRKAWKGAAGGALFMLILFIGFFGIGLETGLGPAVDFLIVFIPGSIAAILSPFIIYPVILLFKKMDNRFLAVLLSSVILLIILLSQVRASYQILPLSYGIIGAGILGGGAIGFWWNSKRNKLSSLLVLVMGLICFSGLALWLWSPGIDRYPTAAIDTLPKNLEAEDPSKSGQYDVRTFTYGSGTDQRRSQFAEDAEYTTDSVNASLVTGGWNKYRTWFWGFDRTELPLNGTVWMPEGAGKFPLVLMVHGNHAMEDFSDEGYAYLGELLASRGYIAVSIDENFLNTSSWSGSLNNEISTRAWLMLKHLSQFEEFNESKSTELYNKVDFDNIALLGHSRGGQAAAVATEFNKLDRYPNNGMVTFRFDYKIKSVISIAPTDYFTLGDKPVQLEDVNYLLLHGSYDSDVSEFSGDRQYDGVKFSGDDELFKSSLYIHGANHGQFNTTWGDNDTSFPMNLFINKEPLLEGDEQRQVAKTYISGFLDVTLKGKSEYKPMFKDYSYALQWLPETAYINRYSDSHFKVINDFENDYDISTGNMDGVTFKGVRLRYWKEGMLKSRENADRESHGVYLKWDESYSNPAKYQMELSEGFFSKRKITDDDIFTFSAASMDSMVEASNFTIRLITEDGETAEAALGDSIELAPALHIQHSKTWFYQEARYGNSHEPVLQTFMIPFEKFNLSVDNVTTIEIVFDKTPQGHIFLDEIGVLDGEL